MSDEEQYIPVNNPIGLAIGDIIREHPGWSAIFALASLSIVVGGFYEMVEAFAPKTKFSYAATNTTGKYISAEGGCEKVAFDPTRNLIVIPLTCTISNLDNN